MNGTDPGRGADPAGEAWLAAVDGLVAGVHHALNNRLAAVSALVQLAALDAGPAPDALRALRQELELCGRTTRLLGMIPRQPREEPIPLRLADLLPDVLALARHHPELRDVEVAADVAPDLLPVLCPETALAHALLALLVWAGAAAREGGAARVDVRCSGDERHVAVEVEPEGDAAGAPPATAGLAALLAAAGGEAEVTEAGIIARLPTLAEGRRRAQAPA